MFYGIFSQSRYYKSKKTIYKCIIIFLVRFNHWQCLNYSSISSESLRGSLLRGTCLTELSADMIFVVDITEACSFVCINWLAGEEIEVSWNAVVSVLVVKSSLGFCVGCIWIWSCGLATLAKLNCLRELAFFNIFTSNWKLQSHVLQIGVNEQNTERHTEQTYPMSMSLLWQKQAAL